jgi:hypothetical protein
VHVAAVALDQFASTFESLELATLYVARERRRTRTEVSIVKFLRRCAWLAACTCDVQWNASPGVRASSFVSELQLSAVPAKLSSIFAILLDQMIKHWCVVIPVMFFEYNVFTLCFASRR